MRTTIVLCVLFAAVSALSAAPVRSEARVLFSDPVELRAQLGPLLGELDICTTGENGDGRHFLVVFADAGQLDAIRQRGVEVEVTWPDIRDKFRAVTGCDPDGGSFRDFGYFFNYWELQDTLRRLAAKYPAITQLDSSMLSFQNRPLWCLKISDNPQVVENEPQVFFNGATHAREPLGTHTCVAFASLLLSGYGTDSLATWLVNNRETYFVPVTNPDGYVYNSDSGGPSSYWRKNRRGPVPPNIGIDLNRNYGYKWGYDNSGSSPTPSAETYRGPNRFSEPEVEAIHQFERNHKFRAQIDFHTYGQYNMYPWAYIGSAPPEQALLQEIIDTFAMHNQYQNNGQWYQTLYPSNGTSVDWEFADTLDAGVPKFVSYAFSCELGIQDFWYGWDDSAYVESEIALNIPNCWYLTRLGGVWLEPVSMAVNDSNGNNTGRLDPGEQANLWFTVKNRALHSIDTAQQVTATLISLDPGLYVSTPGAVFPSIPRRTSADNRASQFTVSCDSSVPPGDTIELRLEVTFRDAGVEITQPLQFRIVLGDSAVAVAEPRTPAVEPRPQFSAAPNPARGSVRFAFNRALSGPATVHVFSGSGQLVRVLSCPSTPAPRPSSLAWDCCDAAGARVPPGIYFARLETGETRFTRKLVVQR